MKTVYNASARNPFLPKGIKIPSILFESFVKFYHDDFDTIFKGRTCVAVVNAFCMTLAHRNTMYGTNAEFANTRDLRQ